VVVGGRIVMLASAGHVILGASLSAMFTTNEHVPLLFEVSNASHVTVVCPSGKVVSAIVREHVTSDTPTLSTADPAATDGALNTTTPVFVPGDVCPT
jgi:hypothetical protein